MSKTLISLKNLSKVYLTDELETHALSNIDLDIPPGEFLAITGPSGCGKSTLLGLIGLLDKPSSGTYHLNGSALHQLNAKQRAQIRNREIGFIFQSFNLIGDLTVFENVALPLTYRSTKSDLKEAVDQALEKVGMGHRSKHYPHQLSGGQQQRVAVARAIVSKPSLLLADEPTGNLDSQNGEKVMDMIEALHAEGTTVCMVTHDPRHARMASRCIHLFDGKIVDESTQEQEVAV